MNIITWFDSSYYHILYKNRDYKEAREFVKTNKAPRS